MKKKKYEMYVLIALLLNWTKAQARIRISRKKAMKQKKIVIYEIFNYNYVFEMSQKNKLFSVPFCKQCNYKQFLLTNSFVASNALDMLKQIETLRAYSKCCLLKNATNWKEWISEGSFVAFCL